ncbi:lysophospholipid acyltransferase family protein [Streptomyces brevispora]|uniref:1-acyl-sn-glycerol-3-phosphate acyltransferase n=1 Tax=Streptomyces brevispora TaxID=887462 RepID=A0ABZ1G026_9ACTN|nr:lysophospholipid acyltransferase family protein [Streptomyces brevispora]WSC13192.1 1-acyl-sn-glycerol-3-phosphate acyltransferase [Streptomyces brevispora]
MLYSLARLVLVPLLRLIYRPVIRGRGNVPRRGPVILASNHLSFIDSIVIALLAPRPVHFLAKDEYFTGTGVRGAATRLFFTAFGCIPVDRRAHRSAQASLHVAEQVVTSGRAFGIYPEGTRSLDGRLYRGRTGVAWLALATGAPVVPVALTGTERLQPVGRRLPRFHRITVEFGAPLQCPRFQPELPPAQARRAVTDRIVEAIGDLSGQEYAEVYGRTPVARASH